MKKFDVERIIATNAVGSLQEDLLPQTLVIPTQIFDRINHHSQTFFKWNNGTYYLFPSFCQSLSHHLSKVAKQTADNKVSAGGTYVCIEGTQFSTQSKSEFYRNQGWEIIGMTAIPEIKLAKEAKISYATITGVTDHNI